MQGIPDGLSARIEAQKRRKLEALRVAMEADAEIDRLTELDRVEHKTPDERRADIRRRNTRGVRKTLAAVGALGLAEFLRSHRRAAVAVAMTAGAAGAIAVAPDSATDLLDIAPDEPSVVATPSPGPEPGRDGAGKRQGRLPLAGAVEFDVPVGTPSTVGPTPRTGDAAPGPTPGPAVTRTPQPSPPGTTAPEPAPPEPPPEPEPEPPPPPEDEPEPLPSVTAQPPEVTATPDDEPLLCVEVDELLGVCADLDLPVGTG